MLATGIDSDPTALELVERNHRTHQYVDDGRLHIRRARQKASMPFAVP